jgi:hypothetical protein
MHGLRDADFSDEQGLALVHNCPNCDLPRVMSLEAIRPAMFGHGAIIGYRCAACGTRRIDVVSSHAVGHSDGASLFHRRFTDRHNPAAAL